MAVNLPEVALPRVTLGATGLRVSVLGLGCSRLGSALANCSGQTAIRLVQHAVGCGIILFDTANIYGQGDSERLLGRAIGGRRNDVVLVTKAGQRFTRAQRITSLAKGPVRHLARRLPSLRSMVAAQRARPLQRDYTPEHMRNALEGSLRRLNTDWVDLFLLHSPDVADMQEDHLFEMLERAQERGLILHWGVSCDDLPTAKAALQIPGLSVLQLPLAIAETADETATLAVAAAARQVGLLVRGVVSRPPNQESVSTWRSSRIASALALPNAAVLVGTTRVNHLDDVLAYLTGPPLRWTVPQEAQQ